MSKTLFSAALAMLIFAQMSLADQLMDKCSSPDTLALSDISLLLRQAVKEARKDCIQAMVANPNYNNRAQALEVVRSLSTAEQAFVLRAALQSSDTWNPPVKIGEDISAFAMLVERYLEMLQGVGVNATKQQLLSDSGRIDLMRLLEVNQDRSPQPSNEQNAAQQKPRITDSLESHSLSIKPVSPETKHELNPKAPTPSEDLASSASTQLLTALDTKPSPWLWINGAILLLAVAGGILFKFLRK